MSTRGALAVIAAVVIAVGFLLALLPVSANGVACGSALGPDSSKASAAEFRVSLEDAFAGGDGDVNGGFQASCEDRVTTQRLVAYPLAGVGGLALVFLALTSKGKPVSEPVERSDP